MSLQALVLRLISGFLALIGLTAFFYLGFREYKIRTSHPLPPVHALEKSAHGSLLVRGKSPNLPPFLHFADGPGRSEIPSMYHFQPLLEEHFQMIQIDPPGFGLAWRNQPPASIEQLLKDQVLHIQELEKRFQKKIALGGHGFGAVLALLLAQKVDPAFLVVQSLPLNVQNNYLNARKKAEAQAQVRKMSRAYVHLGSATPPLDVQKALTIESWTHKLGGELSSETARENAWLAWYSPYCSLKDLVYLNTSIMRLFPLYWPEYSQINLDTVKELSCPVLCIYGENDFYLDEEAFRAWFAQLKSPRKEASVLDHTGHHPAIEKPTLFQCHVLKFSGLDQEFCSKALLDQSGSHKR